MKRFMPFVLALLMLTLGCTPSNNTIITETKSEDIFDSLASSGQQQQTVIKDTERKTADETGSIDFCPTNYCYWGKVTNSTDGTAFFVLYNISNGNDPLIQICRMAPEETKGEVIWSENAFSPELPVDAITYIGRSEYYVNADGNIDKYVISYYGLTAYMDRLYFLRCANDTTALWWIHTDGSDGGEVYSWNKNYRNQATHICRDGKYLIFPWNQKLNMETNSISTLFDINEENGAPILLGADGGYLYYYLGREELGYNESFSGLKRLLVENNSVEDVAPEDYVQFTGMTMNVSNSFRVVRYGAVWQMIGDFSIFNKFEYETGKWTNVSGDYPDIIGPVGISSDGVYFFNSEFNLFRYDLDFENKEVLTNQNPSQEYVKTYTWIAGERVFYLVGENGCNLCAIGKGDTSFSLQNVMGNPLDDPDSLIWTATLNFIY